MSIDLLGRSFELKEKNKARNDCSIYIFII